MNEPQLVELTAEIVSAHVANNKVSLTELPLLVRNVHSALAALGDRPEPPRSMGKKPIIPLKASVKPDHVACLLCGIRKKMLKRHLQLAHGMAGDEYRQMFDLPPTYPLVAPNYSEQRVEIAKLNGLGVRGSRKAVLEQVAARGRQRKMQAAQASR